MNVVIIVSLIIALAISLEHLFVSYFKISYYEQKLKSIGVDISKVQSINLLDIIKLED